MIHDQGFLPLERVIDIESRVLGPAFPWYFNSASAPHGFDGGLHQTIRAGMGDDVQLVHDLYKDGKPLSPYYEMAIDIFDLFRHKHGIKVQSILRAKANLTLSSGRQIVAPAHVDYTTKHSVFIYYVNDSDGDTLIYDQQFTEDKAPILTIGNRITPKAGSAVMFDGLSYHSPSLPVASRYRAVINLCFT